MIRVEHIEVFNFEGAIRGLRNPMNSWDKSDSKICFGNDFTDCTVDTEKCQRKDDKDFCKDVFCIGKNDMSLMRRLYKGGTEHRKYLRQIFVSMDITAPLYWWKEFDTYKVGTVANSCSTMHKIADHEFTLDDFSVEHLKNALPVMNEVIESLNNNREFFIKTKKKYFWWQMIQLLPSSYNQKRTVTMNYENVVTILKQREGHKLDEWNTFCGLLKQLPYIEEITRKE